MKELLKALDTAANRALDTERRVKELEAALDAARAQTIKLERSGRAGVFERDGLLDRISNLEAQLSETKVHADDLKKELDKRIVRELTFPQVIAELESKITLAEAEAARFKKEADAANEKIAKLELAPPAPPQLDELSAEAPRSAELGYKLGYNEGFEQARGDLKELLRAMTACPPARSGE